MKLKMWPRWGQESFLGEMPDPEISRWSSRCGQDRVKKAFLVKCLTQRFQDEAQDVAKMGSRKLSWPYLGHILSFILKSLGQAFHQESFLDPILATS